MESQAAMRGILAINQERCPELRAQSARVLGEIGPAEGQP
jgi:hypothetical protein